MRQISVQGRSTQFLLTRVFLWIGIAICLLGVYPVYSQQPYSSYIIVMYRISGENCYEYVEFENVKYVNDDPENYCGHKTCCDRQFQHSHTPHGFGTECSGTAAESDAYWDLFYGASYTMLSGSTCSYNCTGYAMDRSYWIGPNETSVAAGIILEDEYEDFSGDPACPVAGDIAMPYSSHWCKIISMCTSGECCKAQTTKEKNGSGGVYQRVRTCPAGGATFYKVWRKLDE